MKKIQTVKANPDKEREASRERERERERGGEFRCLPFEYYLSN